MAHVCLIEIFPAECEVHGYKVVGLAYREARGLIPEGLNVSQLKAKTQEMLADPESLEILRGEASALIHDPWIWAIERYRRCGPELEDEL